MLTIFAKSWVVAAALLAAGCAYVHHVQLGELEPPKGGRLERFDVKVSEMGVNLDEAADIARGMTSSKQAREDIDQVRAIIGLFQMGPTTGNPVYDDRYARELIKMIHARCPRGGVTGLAVVREMNKYPVISGEIVRITGWCRK